MYSLLLVTTASLVATKHSFFPDCNKQVIIVRW